MTLLLNVEGYLEQLDDWSQEAASELAALESITLTASHWELITLVRSYYQKFDHSPSMRPLVKWVKQEAGLQNGNSIYLHTLFPVSPAKQLAKIAGLPKPRKCL
jgi:tRNA 2-thiouridine synthesizing protein E